MELPNYFIADLPPEARISPQTITEACETLRRNRQHYLAGRSTQSLVGILCAVAENWLQPDYPIRHLLLDRAPALTGFSQATLLKGIENFFRQLTRENFQALLEQELGHGQRLDGMVATGPEERAQRAALASGPELIGQFTTSSVPTALLTNIILGFLVRSAQFVKCATGSSVIPRLFAHSIYESDPKLASCLEIAEWPEGVPALENALLAESNCVVASGSDDMLLSLRSRLPPVVRFLGFGERLSFGYITREALSGFNPKKVIEPAIEDIVAWNQRGSLAPHVLYVENGGNLSAEAFAASLAQALEAREQVEPLGPLLAETAALITSRRSFYEVRAHHSSETRLWFSPNDTKWSVIFETDPLFQTSCSHRFIYVKAVANLNEALHGADQIRARVSNVGLAATEDKAETLATTFARWGATRVCPLGQMQNPPLTWRHNGRPTLGELVTWTDWEQA